MGARIVVAAGGAARRPTRYDARPMATVSAPHARSDFARDEDGLVVARVRAGDVDAFERIVVRYRDVAVRVAAGIVGRDEAEDVTQDAFLRALHRIDQYRGTAPFRAWLMRIVTNTALNALDQHLVRFLFRCHAGDAPRVRRVKTAASCLLTPVQR